MGTETKRGDYALRFYMQGDGTGNLLCRLPNHECPQWHYTADHRYTFPTPAEARAFLGTIRGEWPEFKRQDVRVVRVIPPEQERYVEVPPGCVRCGLSTMSGRRDEQGGPVCGDWPSCRPMKLATA
jgi:hypothetical protein